MSTMTLPTELVRLIEDSLFKAKELPRHRCFGIDVLDGVTRIAATDTRVLLIIRLEAGWTASQLCQIPAPGVYRFGKKTKSAQRGVGYSDWTDVEVDEQPYVEFPAFDRVVPVEGRYGCTIKEVGHYTDKHDCGVPLRHLCISGNVSMNIHSLPQWMVNYRVRYAESDTTRGTGRGQYILDHEDAPIRYIVSGVTIS